MSKEQIIIPARDYEKYKLWTDINRAYNEMRREQPDKSNNVIHTYIGGTYGVSISTVINAISRCTETTSITLTRE